MSEATMEVVDCDFHCAPISFDVLAPYLDEYWVTFIAGSSMYLADNVKFYPPGMGGGATPTSFNEWEQVRNEGVRRNTTILTCTTHFGLYRNPAFRAAFATALNDWLRAEWLDRDESLRASMVISTSDVNDAVAEIERLASDDRFVQVVLPVRTDRPWGSREFHPVYEAAASHGLAVALHAGGKPAGSMTQSGIAATFMEDYTTDMRTVQAHVLSLVSEGVFSRFESLRVVLQQCGFTWLPHVGARFDKEWRALYREVPWVEHLPSEYISRSMRATTAPSHLGRTPRQAAESLEMVGSDWLMYASDFPHEHGDDPARLWDAMDDDAARGVAHDNAVAFYSL